MKIDTKVQQLDKEDYYYLEREYGDLILAFKCESHSHEILFQEIFHF